MNKQLYKRLLRQRYKHVASQSYATAISCVGYLIDLMAHIMTEHQLEQVYWQPIPYGQEAGKRIEPEDYDKRLLSDPLQMELLNLNDERND